MLKGTVDRGEFKLLTEDQLGLMLDWVDEFRRIVNHWLERPRGERLQEGEDA